MPYLLPLSVKKQLVLLVLLILASTTWSSAQSLLEFNLVNKTGLPFYGVYLTATDTEVWEGNILKQPVMLDEAEVEIKVKVLPNSSCKWDLKMTEYDSEKTWILLKGLDLCKASILTLFIEEDGDYGFKID
jgi:hypothetical protein